jgi:anti-anti-sigma factor
VFLLGQREATIKVCPRGELDVGASRELAEQLFTAVTAAHCRLLIVDLEGVSFLDVSAVGVLERTRQVADAVGVDFVIANPGRVARRVMELIGALPRLTTPSFHTPN